MKHEQSSKAAIIGAVLIGVVILLFLGWLWLRDQSEKDTKPFTMTIKDVGFMTPESVLYDAESDRYLVSNINGAPLEKDDNGFISLISPNGQITDLKWISGEDEATMLNAPKGMAILDSKLYVADINTVRVFDLSNGKQLKDITIKDTSFLNDIVSDDEETLYVSDSGLNAAFESTGRDAIYSIADDKPLLVLASTELDAPNGLALNGNDLLIVPFNGNNVLQIDVADPKIEVAASLPAGQLDGIVRMPDDTLYVSSWESQSIYKVDRTGESNVQFDNMPAPADLGWDIQRNRLLVPLFNNNAVEIREI